MLWTVSRDAARTARLALREAEVTTSAPMLIMFSVLGRISVAVCVPAPTSPSYRPLTTAGFLLAEGYTCYRDSSNDPQCSLYSTYTTISFTISTSTTPYPTDTPNDDGDNGDDDLPDDPNSNSNSSSSSSSSQLGPTGFPSVSSQASGVTGWKDARGSFVFARFLALIGTCIQW